MSIRAVAAMPRGGCRRWRVLTLSGLLLVCGLSRAEDPAPLPSDFVEFLGDGQKVDNQWVDPMSLENIEIPSHQTQLQATPSGSQSDTAAPQQAGDDPDTGSDHAHN